MDVSNASPDSPLYISSLPDEAYPNDARTCPNFLAFSPLFAKAVQSAKPPRLVHAFPMRVSTSCPIVIRLGKACGFIIISGRIPSAV